MIWRAGAHGRVARFISPWPLLFFRQQPTALRWRLDRVTSGVQSDSPSPNDIRL